MSRLTSPDRISSNLLTSSLFSLDAVLPSQYQHRYRPVEPERLLLIALIEQAVHDLEMYRPRAATNWRAMGMVRDAEEWIGRCGMEPFGFGWCCQHLGLEAGKIREAVGV